MAKVLIATEKPFAKAAVDGIKKIFTEAGFETVLLEKYTDPNDLIKAVADVDALIIRSDKATHAVIEAAKNLKIIVRAGAGYDNIDIAAATEKGICAMNTPGQNSNAVAELALGLMVFMSRGQFKGISGTELKGKKLGIQAYGAVGKCVAKITKGFGMELWAYDPYACQGDIVKDGLICAQSVENLYSSCDYISVNIPANEKTKKSINFELMSKMPKGAIVVNTARKEVIDEESLKKMFAERPDFKYASDIAPDCHADLLQYNERYYATPKKQGAETSEANINAGLAAANQIVGFLKNGDRTFQVNK
ncbi:MAG: 3-phosphoglycerate dehydrogenase [Bacteroidetes bacterium RIFOXYA12_FULL_35_11]|nr:MAG: 3-phosphoglycerate dehydrogenase [Bacteroidetes bacterium GWF2_35_48]OFY82916.1 MAG: 3-phosphoglycerate dehydrogenase [Bacteroidetes bacterium RIFOXYA12_FULL_35_11]OFZ01870.1 MAG: 3-phosphoglycerate dehydrogenase [Bacteroidetes bacterium RIFOXYC12_FULL_35_7]HBX52772.1 3-phosphoglycerate dehydrogenase [Bacteroidales bacterium]